MGMKPRRPTGPGTIEIGGQELDEKELADEVERELDRLLEEQGEEGSDFATYEQRVLKIVHEIARHKLKEKLQSIADSLAERVLIEHSNTWHGYQGEDALHAYRRHSVGTVTYHSLVGGLRIRRHVYRQCRWRGLTHVPLELSAGLMERMTPALAKSVAIGYAYMPPRQCEQFMRTSGLVPPSRSTLDRAARDLGSYAVTCNAEIEPLVRANEVVDPKARAIALGLDRTSVPMRHGEEGAGRELYADDMRRSRPKPTKRDRIRGSVQWRLDYVGTVSLLDKAGAPLATRKYRLPGEANPMGIVERMAADVRHALMQRPLPVSIIQDGAPDLWRVLTRALDEEPSVANWTEVLDWYHLDERLSKCLDLCADARKRKAQRNRWHKLLFDSDDGIARVIRSLQRQKNKLEDKDAEQLQVHINYFVRNKHRARYASRRANSMPIGSGITEGACKSVIGARAKRSGQRWSQRGLTSALHLRSVHQSDRFEAFWPFFSQRYRARHIIALGDH
jgi:hypothetical protein